MEALMFNILVAEDDSAILKLTTDTLRENGYHPIPAKTGAQALEIMDTHSVDLLILDVMMPPPDGFELSRLLRESGCDLPIIMVTAKETAADKRLGFLSGTDDYLTKPFDEEELLLRINALLRRYKIASERRISIGGTALIFDSLLIETADGELTLPQKEFLLLFKLLGSIGKTFTRRQLMDDIWGIDSNSDEHTISVHINRLRDRFGDSPDFEIVTVRGLGYKAVRH